MIREAAMDTTGAEEITLIVNGESRSVPAGLTIAGLLLRLDLPGERVAVEHNREIISRGRFADLRLHDGDQLEIVQFVGGG